MPAWEELEVYSRGGTADAADRTADAADRTADKTDRAALVGVGAAGVLSFVLAATLFTSRVLTRRQPSKRASRGGGGSSQPPRHCCFWQPRAAEQRRVRE